jgi:hypothetical protein
MARTTWYIPEYSLRKVLYFPPATFEGQAAAEKLEQQA